MQNRVSVTAAQPKALQTMLGLEQYLSGTSLSKTLKELIKIRASQINGCAYCINMHTEDALKAGETNQRIFLLSAWRESGDLFSEEERLVLKMTEEITLIHRGGLSDKTYEQALQFFEEHQIAEVVMAIITINMWNRVAITSHTPVSAV